MLAGSTGRLLPVRDPLKLRLDASLFALERKSLFPACHPDLVEELVLVSIEPTVLWGDWCVSGRRQEQPAVSHSAREIVFLNLHGSKRVLRAWGSKFSLENMCINLPNRLLLYLP